MAGFWAESFLEMMVVERGASHHTIDAYRRDLASYEGFLGRRDLQCESADVAAVRAWLAQLSAEGLSAATMARRLSAIRQLHRFLYLEGARAGRSDPDRRGPAPAAARCRGSSTTPRSRR